MDFSNKKDQRMRVDYEYDSPMTIDDFTALIDYLQNEEQYFVPPDDYYGIEKINSLIIYTVPTRGKDTSRYLAPRNTQIEIID